MVLVGQNSKFADDSKLGAMGSEEGCQRIEQVIDQLQIWAEK